MGVLVWKIKDLASRLSEAKTQEGLELVSAPFYTSQYGYKVQASLFLNGNGGGENSHMSVYIKVLFPTQIGRIFKDRQLRPIRWDLDFPNLYLMKCWNKEIMYETIVCLSKLELIQVEMLLFNYISRKLLKKNFRGHIFSNDKSLV